MGLKERLRVWRVTYFRDWTIQNQRTGEVTLHRTPLPLRVSRLVVAPFYWLGRHWLAHWKFWLNFIVAWAAVFVALAQWLDSQKC